MTGISGLSAYQKSEKLWKQTEKASSKTTEKATERATEKASETSSVKTDSSIKKTTWKPIDITSSLVPTKREDIGMAIGNVNLSDKAKDYLASLKSKFGNMEFITVSKDMKAQVQANAAAYGNASKQVVLIDDEKLERMAEDPEYRKKYEGIIAMSQSQLAAARNSLASSGANVKSFGMSVNSDGSTSFFATLEKSSEEQTKLLEKRQAKKAAEKKASEKKAAKKAAEKKNEAKKAEKKAEAKVTEENSELNTEEIQDNKQYVKIQADSLEALLSNVAKYSYESTASTVVTEAEKMVGQSIDFKG